MEAFMEVDEEFADTKAAPKVVKKEEIREPPLAPLNGPSHAEEKKKMLDTTPTWLSVYDSLTVAAEDSSGPLASSNSGAGSSSQASVLEDDGSLRFYWMDYLENDGKIYFIGKTQDKRSNKWLSCCVTVENLQRNLFVLPREYRIEVDEETGETVNTDVVPSMQDVYADFDKVRRKAGITTWRAKFVDRKYAFGESDVPRRETKWLKVVYGFNGRSLLC